MTIRNNRTYFLAILIVTLALLSTARADQMPGGTSSSDSSSYNILHHLHASYFGIFHGPGLESFGSPNTVDQNGILSTSKYKDNRMNMDSEINILYSLTDIISVSPVIPFLLYTTEGSGASLGDLGFKVTDKNTLLSSDVSLSTNLIFQLPTSDYSKLRKMDYAVKTTPSIRYIIPDTRFSIGSFSEVKAYLGVISGKTFKLYAAPFVNYQLTHKLSANLAYEVETDHYKGLGGSFDFRGYQSDFMPGFVYMIAPTLMINPYLQVFTNQNIDTGHMAVGAMLAAAI